MLAPGTVLGSYRIERELGRGGMGEVYLAYDTTLHRQAAVKVLGVNAAAARADLLREARSAAALRHPNICTIFEVATDDTTSFIAMEYIEGESLRQRLDTRRPSMEETLHYGAQLADALAYAHGRGIVHRDLKAANIIVEPDGRIKIVDFGIARRTGASMSAVTTVTNHSVVGQTAGTPYVMAPEQVRGETVDGRADIWALGVLVYELVSGTTPFDATQPVADLFSSILRDPPKLLPPLVPQSLQSVVYRCLEKTPARRYQTAAEVRAALDALRDVAVAPGGARRKRALAVSAITAALVLAVATAAGIWLPRATPAEPPPRLVSLAVLPLEDRRRDSDRAYFSEGMTEVLIGKLARIDGLRVTPRAAVAKYRGANRVPAVVARELAVDAILDGTVDHEGDRVRITVTLIDPRANRAIWAENYDEHLRDVLTLQTNVARAIVNELRVQLTPRDQAEFARRTQAVDGTAYDLYLRGLTLLERVNARDAEQAIAALEKAVALDPTFADAFGVLAAAYSVLYGSFGPEDGARLEPKARAAINNALALDPDSADAIAAEGDLVWDTAHGWPHEEAIQAHRKALSLKPTLVRSKTRLATIYNHIGLPDMALLELEQSDDSPAVLMQKGLAFRMQGRTALALAAWLAIPESARNTNHVGHIAWALIDSGRPDEAMTLLRGRPDDEDGNGMIAAADALLRVTNGDRSGAAARLSRVTERATTTRESHHSTYLAAVAFAKLGQRDQALHSLRFTVSNGFPCYPLIAGDAALDSLRDDPAFSQFLAELKTRSDGYRSRLSRRLQ